MPRLTPPPLTQEPEVLHPVLGATLGPCAHAVLGDPGGVTQFGVHLEMLPPGSRSSFRHWHETEDEMVCMLSGSVMLIEDRETPLHPGDVAAWPAGSPAGHCLENRSETEARYLTIGSRHAVDRIHDPDHDLITEKTGSGRRSFHADGRERMSP